MRDLLANLYRQLQDPSFWTVANVSGLLATVVAVVALALTLWELYQRRRTQRMIMDDFGTDFYQLPEIESAARYYVRPDCSSVDPAQEMELRHVIATKEDLFDAVDRYVMHEAGQRHILLLADSGMGKSSFILSYYARNKRLPKRKRQRLAIIQLGRPGDALEEIEKIEHQKSTVLFLDAFDEDIRAIQNGYRSRLDELMKACERFKRVLITCRTQFFDRDDEIPRETGILRVGPRKLGESNYHEFWKLYILPLNDRQIEKFLSRRYPLWQWNPIGQWKKRDRARTAVAKVPLLSVRPMLLTYIPDLLKIGDFECDFAVQLYDHMVNRWLDREQPWVDRQKLGPFSESLAVDLYVNQQQRGAALISREELDELLKTHPIPIDDWQIKGRSLLNRDGAGNFKFAHRSIMEHLFVRRFFAGDPNCRDIEWTDLMKKFCLERAYLHYRDSGPRPLDLRGADLTNTESVHLPALYRLRSKPITVSSLNAGLAMARAETGLALAPIHIFARQKRDDGMLVTDHATGLTWQQVGSPQVLNFDHAQRYVADLNAQHHCGYDDWRLPTADELVLTMGGAGISDAPFDQERLTFWTGDMAAGGWAIYYLYAQLRVQKANTTAYVRAVRSISEITDLAAPSPRFGQPKVLTAP
jgi:hypothetical protein